MKNRLSQMVIIVVWLVLSMVMLRRILSGGILNYIQVALIVTPLVVILLQAYRHYWIAILLATVVLGVSLKIPLVSALAEPLRAVPMLMLILMVGSTTISKQPIIPSPTAADRMMVIAAGISTIWLIIKRPGSALLGAETGGLATSLSYVIGLWSFLLGGHLIRHARSYRTSLISVLWLSMISWVFFLVSRTEYLGEGRLFALFHRSAWLAFSALLAVAAHAWARNGCRGISSRLALIGFTMLLFSAMTSHRSRPMMAVGMIGTVAYVYKKLGRFSIMVGAVVLAGTMYLMAAQPSWVPRSAYRAMSIFAPALITDPHLKTSTGWQDETRGIIYGEAFRQIKQNPLGRGYGINVEQLLAALGSVRHRDARMGQLFESGGFHNTWLALTVYNGIPTGILYLVAAIMIIFRFARWTRDLPAGWQKAYASMLLIYCVPVVMQFTINGGHRDIIVATSLLGLMAASMKPHCQIAETEIIPVESPDAPTSHCALPQKMINIPV